MNHEISAEACHCLCSQGKWLIESVEYDLTLGSVHRRGRRRRKKKKVPSFWLNLTREMGSAASWWPVLAFLLHVLGISEQTSIRLYREGWKTLLKFTGRVADRVCAVACHRTGSGGGSACSSQDHQQAVLQQV